MLCLGLWVPTVHPEEPQARCAGWGRVPGAVLSPLLSQLCKAGGSKRGGLCTVSEGAWPTFLLPASLTAQVGHMK